MELRRNERSTSNTPAVIRTEDAAPAISCVVCNLSEGGAKLVVEGSDPLPTEFILFLRPNSPVGRRCQTIWRMGDKVGVRSQVNKAGLDFFDGYYKSVRAKAQTAAQGTSGANK